MEGGPFRGPFKFEAVQYPDKLGKIGSNLINIYFPNLHHHIIKMPFSYDILKLSLFDYSSNTFIFVILHFD